MYGFSGWALCFNAITWNNIHLPARNNPVYKCFSLNDTFLISESEKKIFQNGGRFFTYFVEIYIEKILVSFVFQTNIRKNAIVPWNFWGYYEKFLIINGKIYFKGDFARYLSTLAKSAST